MNHISFEFYDQNQRSTEGRKWKWKCRKQKIISEKFFRVFSSADVFIARLPRRPWRRMTIEKEKEKCWISCEASGHEGNVFRILLAENNLSSFWVVLVSSRDFSLLLWFRRLCDSCTKCLELLVGRKKNERKTFPTSQRKNFSFSHTFFIFYFPIQ